MIYEASNYMEGIKDHFQANQLLFISVYQSKGFTPKNMGGGHLPPKLKGGGHLPPKF